MFMNTPIFIVYGLFVLLVVGIAVSLIVLMWAGVRALNAITDERRMNIDERRIEMELFLAGDSEPENE
jgi:hypothetical protein